MISALQTIADWLHAYRAGGLQPVAAMQAWAQAVDAQDVAWIHRATLEDLLAQAQALADRAPSDLPLYGVPFAVKDNIDVAGWPTTAACPAFAYTPTASADVVRHLQAAGAIVVGKTNLDQFATGLVGTRSPYGAVPNTFDARYVCGGSSSGSASLVSRAIVPFALGTDTAGSGRVPAGLNHIVGLKPTPGAVPMGGVVPACKSLDVVSVFALDVREAGAVMAAMAGPSSAAPLRQAQPQRPWLGRSDRDLRVGVIQDAALDAALGFDVAYAAAQAQVTAMGLTPVRVSMDDLSAVARLLYEGPWVAERHTVVAELMAKQPEALDPTVAQVISAATAFSAADAFRAQYALAEGAQRAAALWSDIDVLMVPTAPTCPTLAQVAQDPVARNSALGRYTNFVNLLGWSALAVPASISTSGLPFGVTFIAPGGCDAALVEWGARWQAQAAQAMGAARVPLATDAALARPASATSLRLAVVGAHLTGMPLHSQLVERGCRRVASTHTAPSYRLYALANTQPPKPGLLRVDEEGVAVAVEVYDMPLSEVGSFLALIPHPLGLGQVELADGSWVHGFICEPQGLSGAKDISAWGGWRAYLADQQEVAHA